MIAGQAYYKVVPTHNRQGFKLEIGDPLNTWVDKDPKSRYMKNAYKSVIRKWMTIQEIEIKYGDYLSREDLKDIESWKGFYENTDPSNYALVTGLQSRCGRAGTNPGILDGVGVHPLNDDPLEETWDLVPVYEVEWIDSKKENDKWTDIAMTNQFIKPTRFGTGKTVTLGIYSCEIHTYEDALNEIDKAIDSFKKIVENV